MIEERTDKILYCDHRECRLDASQELMWMAQRLMRPDLAEEATTAMRSIVRCRHLPRKPHEGAPQAPLP